MNNSATQEPKQLSYKDYSILIVDDTPANLGVIVSYLESYGFGIRVARSGEMALKRVQYDLPDIILLDILMPGMDGFETCQQLKALEGARDIPVIFMTSLTGVEDKVRGFEAGAVDYVTKPLDQQEVLARIRIHLRQRDLTVSLQDKNQLLETSSQVERSRLFDAINQQREQLRALNQKLTQVQEAERQQLARELHDELGQALTAITINITTVAQELPSGCAPGLSDRLQEAIALANQTLEQVRELAFNLRPAMLDDLGLGPALRWYVKRCAQRSNLDVHLDAGDLQDRLPAEVETVLYRVVQEALTNVVRHARATAVHIRLEREATVVRAQVEDDGQGFDVTQVLNQQPPHQGIGLLGMRERIALLGGTFTLNSASGQGTRLALEIPLGENDGYGQD